jgi:hypothetical protein
MIGRRGTTTSIALKGLRGLSRNLSTITASPAQSLQLRVHLCIGGAIGVPRDLNLRRGYHHCAPITASHDKLKRYDK